MSRPFPAVDLCQMAGGRPRPRRPTPSKALCFLSGLRPQEPVAQTPGRGFALSDPAAFVTRGGLRREWGLRSPTTLPEDPQVRLHPNAKTLEPADAPLHGGGGAEAPRPGPAPAAKRPKPVPVRYEKDHPGELLHLDTKKLGRIRGVGHRIHGDRRTRKRGISWEIVHVALDDHSRWGFSEVLADERGETDRALPAARGPRTPPPRDPGRRRDHRQRLVLREPRVQRGLPGARHRPSLLAALSPADQRQGRTLHPDDASRVGVRSG